MSPTTLRRIALGLLIVLVLWGATRLLARKSDSVSGGWVLPAVSMGDADSVTLERGAAITLLVKRQGSWTANGWPADQDGVAELFRSLHDSSRAELVGEAKASHERFSLDSANAIRVRVYSKGKAVVDWTVGKAGTDYPSVYARRTGEVASYMLHSDIGDIGRKATDQWRDRKITGTPLDSITSIDVQNGRKSYSLRQKAGKAWEFSGGKPADSSKVMALLAHYVNVQASGFATRAQIDSARAHQNRRHAVVKSGNRTLIELSFDSIASGYLVRQPHDSVIYRMETWSAGDLTPADSTLKPASLLPAFTPTPAAPSKAPRKSPAKKATTKKGG